MVAGDAFRAPKDPLLLCVEVGSGVQIISSASVTLIFAALGAHRLPPKSCPPASHDPPPSHTGSGSAN